MRCGDLDALDRTTLRLWRIANLVGWAAGGAIAFALPWVLGRQLGGRVSAVILVPLGIIALVLVPYLAGGVIGDHIYRWPGLGAAGAVGAVNLWWLALSPDPSEEGWGFAAVAFISLLISVTTARYRWRLRPRALRGGLPR
jgi:hypothetical protein